MEKQKRFILPIIFFSLIMAGVFAVSWYKEKAQITTLTIATGGKTGQYYAFAQALAQVLARHHPSLRLQILETAGSTQNEELIAKNKVSLALLQNDTPLAPSTKVVSFLFPEMFHLIATKQSGIKSVNDLKGKKIALMPKGSGSYALFWTLSEHYELKATDFQAIPLKPDEAHAALKAGKVDALFRVVALGSPGVTQLLQNPNIYLVPIDQGAALQLSLPALEENQIPKGTYNGAIPIPSQDLPVVAVRAILVAHQKVDQRSIYDITRILYESRNELVKKNTVTALIRQPNADEHLGFSFHPGALAFYDQGKPSFLVEYSEPIGLILSASVLAISSLWQLRLWFKNKQKNRADFYNLEIVKLIGKIDSINNLNDLEAIRNQLFSIFEKVIFDLDKDRISPESFQSFSFPWEVALNNIHHRETVLMNSRLSQVENINPSNPLNLDKKHD